MSDFPGTREELEKALFHRTRKDAVCAECDAPIEWWKSPRGKSLPMTVKLVDGVRDRMTLHLEVCPARQGFRGAGSGSARPPVKFTNEAPIRNMRQRTNARLVVIITDDGGCEATWRDGIPAEDLRQELIAAGNQVRAAIHQQEAKR